MSEARVDSERTMKGLLAVAIKEAVKLALIDSVLAMGADKAHDEGEEWGEATSRLRAEWDQNIYAIPSELIARMDPMALAQNICCRLLGTGGWTISGVYGGNASPAQMLQASIARPGHANVDDVAAAFGEHFDTTTDLDEIQRELEEPEP